MSKVISYKSIGIQKACDLEVDHSDHQFYLANGLLTSNSHAISYSGLSMYQVYLKTYFPREFFASKLQFGSNDPEKKESVYGYRSKLLAEGYKIAPISVNTCSDKIKIDKKNMIYWRLDLIKSIGAYAAKCINKCKPFDSPEDLVKKVKIS